MKRIIAILFILFTNVFAGKTQTTATDFTATDCSGTSWNLFSELNNGKIVVLVWVEPCAGCISDAKAAYVAAHAVSANYPNKVVFWLADDVGNTPCASLISWATTNGIGPGHMSYFDNAGNAMDQNNYGGVDMPHVVVMGGNDHHIYANIPHGINDSGSIANAIVQAITAGVNDVVSAVFKIYPNPANNVLKIDYDGRHPQTITLELMDVMGRVVKTKSIENSVTGKHSIELLLGNEIPAGSYFLKCSTSTESKVFTITKSDLTQ